MNGMRSRGKLSWVSAFAKAADISAALIVLPNKALLAKLSYAIPAKVMKNVPAAMAIIDPDRPRTAKYPGSVRNVRPCRKPYLLPASI